MSDAPFLKMNGLGNEIIVADMRGRADRVTAGRGSCASMPIRRPRFDQIMAIHDPRTPGTANYIEIINSDGSRAAGLRQRHALRGAGAERRDRAARASSSRPLAGILTGEEHADGLDLRRHGQAAVRLAATFRWPRNSATPRGIELQIGPIDAPVLHTPSAVSMGNPHAIFWVEDDVWDYALDRFGPLLENHPIFPERANISIAQVVAPDHIILRTWERGAGLTKACGTAACAAAGQRRAHQPHRPQGDGHAAGRRSRASSGAPTTTSS